MVSKKITIGNENMNFYQVDHSEVHFIWKCILCNNSKSNVKFASVTRFIWSTSEYLNKELDLKKNSDLQTLGDICDYNDQYENLSQDCNDKIGEKISIKYCVICDRCFTSIIDNQITGKERLEKIEKAASERLKAEDERNLENKKFLEKQIAERDGIFKNPSKDQYKSINRYLIIAENKLDNVQCEEAVKILTDLSNYVDSLPRESVFTSNKKIPDDYINRINSILVKIHKLNNSELNTKITNLLKKNNRLKIEAIASFRRKSKRKSRKTSNPNSKRKSKRKSKSKSKSKRKSRKSSKRKTTKRKSK